MNITKQKLALAGSIALAISTEAMAQSPSQIIEQERSRQITRQVSNNIQRRVSSDIDENTSTGLLQQTSLKDNKMAASSDRSSFMPDTIWDTYSWTRIGNDGIAADFDVDVHQNTIAADKKFGDNLYIGGSLTYAYSDLSLNEGAYTHGDNHSVTLTPYLAYVFNKHLFLSALTAYGYSNDNLHGGIGSESETDSYNTELALNALHSIDQWFMTGKVGVRYVHGHSKSESDFTPGLETRDSTDEWIYLTRGEFGYAFANGIRVSNGVLFEYNNPKPNNGTADGVFYYDIGVNYNVNKKLNIGVNASTDLTNEDVNISTVALNARLAM